MQKPLNAIWNFLLKWAFFVYVQLFHFNDNEKNLYLRKMLILEENFRWHLEALYLNSSYVGLYNIYIYYIEPELVVYTSVIKLSLL